MRPCAHCGADLDALGKMPHARYCNHRCSKAAWLKAGNLGKNSSPEHSIRRLREPIPTQPFLDWAEKRRQRLAVEYDDGKGGDRAGIGELMDEIGWDRDGGARRYHRWRHDKAFHGYVERALIEDALWHAGVFFWEIYDDEQVAA